MDDTTDWARLLTHARNGMQGVTSPSPRRVPHGATAINNTQRRSWSPSSPHSKFTRSRLPTPVNEHSAPRNPGEIARANSLASAPAPQTSKIKDDAKQQHQQRTSAAATAAANMNAQRSTTHRRTLSPSLAASDAGRTRLQQKLSTNAQRHEPRAHTSIQAHSEEKSEAASSAVPIFAKSRSTHLSQAHQQQKSKKEPIYCGNNAKSPELQHKRLGRPSECIQKGFGAALHQQVADVGAFLHKFEGEYQKLIEPKLWYKNSEPPPGLQRATLPMCFQKGWGAGTAALARKLRKKMSGKGGD